MKSLLLAVFAAAFARNILLNNFFGLGAAPNMKKALTGGLVSTALAVLASLIAYPISSELLAPLGLKNLEILLFVPAVAALTALAEKLFARPVLPAAADSLVLGIMTIALRGEFYNALGLGSDPLLTALLFPLAAGLGFTLINVLLTGTAVRTQNAPEAVRGLPATLLSASFLALAFYVFSLI